MPWPPRNCLVVTPCRKHPKPASESQRFESVFFALSRVNDSLMQNKSCPTENRSAAIRESESETGTHCFHASWPGLSRHERLCLAVQDVDARHNAGHDD